MPQTWVTQERSAVGAAAQRPVLPALREPVYRASDDDVPEVTADRRAPGPHYFWDWIDSLKAVRYL